MLFAQKLTRTEKKILKTVPFAIKKGRQVYKIKLSQSAEYKGSMSQLVIYPFNGNAKVGDTVKISKVWFSRE